MKAWIVVGVLGLTLIAPGHATLLSKFEPVSGCYIGAFVDRDTTIRGDYAKFSDLTQKKHASYITYVGYGRPFPKEWAERVKAAGAAPHIALEPNNGLKMVKDDAYLRQWARDAYAAECPIFLRFGSEMNGNWCAYHGNPKLYIKKFRLVHDVMQEEAPNVAMVWAPFASPQRTIPDYYPGDEYVDWVGINIYSVYVHDGKAERVAYMEDPVEFLDFIYKLYADRKPIQISEFAATNYCKATKLDTAQFAVEKMTRLYKMIAQTYPRVKAINWFSYNTIEAGLADNDYSLTGKPPVLLAYRSLVADPHFLSTVPFNLEEFRVLKKPPPIPVGGGVRPQPVTPAPQPTPEEEQRDFEEIMSTRGAVVTSMSHVTVRGIANHTTVTQDRELVVFVPGSIRVRYVIFELDGRNFAITNAVPYRCNLRYQMIPKGEHTLRAIVVDREGEEFPSDPVIFAIGAEDD